MALNEGQVVAGKYRVETLLGEGGMGAVYVATNTVLQRRVALKVMNERFAAMDAAVERFHREAIAASRVSHPSIVQVFDAGSHDGKPWIAMELLEGESLGERLERGPLPLDEVLQMAAGALSALAEVHEEGIVHRDLKPDNIFLAKSRGGSWIPKVLDFGVAKDTSEGQLSKLTATGAVVGTAYYLSPEQAKGLPDIDPRTDVYAMGVVLYECLSGDMPYEAQTITQLIAKMFTEAPRPLGSVAPHVPEPIADVIDCCLEQDRERRFQTARSLMGALESASQAIRSTQGVGFAATAHAMQIPSHAGGAAASYPGSPPAPSHAGGAPHPGSHAGAPHPDSSPGAWHHASGAGAPHPDSSPGAWHHASGAGAPHPDSSPGAAMNGAAMNTGRAVYPETAILPGADPSWSAEAAATPVESERGSRFGMIGLVVALFLVGAAGTAGAGYVMFGGDADAARAVAHASEPSASGPASASVDGDTPAASAGPGGAPPRGVDAPADAEDATRAAADDDATLDDATLDDAELDDAELGDAELDDAELDDDESSEVEPGDDRASRRRALRLARRRARAARRGDAPRSDAREDDAPDEPSPTAEPQRRDAIGPSEARVVPTPARAQPQRRANGLSQQQVMSTVQSRLSYLQQRCYQRRAQRVPGLSGIVTVAWTIRPDGRAADPRVVHNGTGDEWLARCTSRMVSGTRFPAASNGESTPARYPFRFGQR